jgi:hypothetical protein
VVRGSPPREIELATHVKSDMVIWVKTTIDIADGLMMAAKERAHQDGTTLRALIERGLSRVLEEPTEGARVPFKAVTFPLEPLPGVDPYDWDAIREEIYESRGGA